MEIAFVRYQQSFIQEFLSPRSARWQALCATPGMGKTTAALEIVQRIYQSNSDSVILFVAPASLAMQAAEILQNRLLAQEPFYFSKQRILELAQSIANFRWPARIVIMGDNLAKQPEVLEILKSSKWDLVVVDEAHRTTSFVEQLLPTLTRARVLLLTGSESVIAASMPSTFKITRWDPSQISKVNDFRAIPVQFHRSIPEKSVVERVGALAGELNEGEEGRVFWRVVRQATKSSFNALEQILTRQVALLRNATNDSRITGMPEDVATRESDLTVHPWRDRERAAEKLLQILDAISQATADEKLSSLLSLLGTITKGRERYGIWIVTSFRATAWYLASSLSELRSGVSVLTADMPYSRALEVTSSIGENQSIIIATIASTKGLQFPNITHIVLYDEPRSKSLLQLVQTRVPAGLPVEVFVFREEA
jgi:ERCC4-related helicase